jgi:hypothetical protein
MFSALLSKADSELTFSIERFVPTSRLMQREVPTPHGLMASAIWQSWQKKGPLIFVQRPLSFARVTPSQ